MSRFGELIGKTAPKAAAPAPKPAPKAAAKPKAPAPKVEAVEESED